MKPTQPGSAAPRAGVSDRSVQRTDPRSIGIPPLQGRSRLRQGAAGGAASAAGGGRDGVQGAAVVNIRGATQRRRRILLACRRGLFL
jgi:hypothetical protein